MSDKNLYEPFELVEIDVPQEYQGIVMQELGRRSADIKNVSPNSTDTEIHFEAEMATRALFGLKNLLITATKGTVIIFSVFIGYKPTVTLELDEKHGSLISTASGKSSAYALFNAQARGNLFIGAGEDVYEGMVIGQSAKGEDLEINPTKGKQLTNMRTKSSDDSIKLDVVTEMGLEKAMEYIDSSEMIEVTPSKIRIRKVHLDPNARKKAAR